MIQDLPAAGTVESAVSDGVATIEFGHPKGNSLPAAILRRLADVIADAGQRTDVRVIALRSAGVGPFCAGASFDELVAIRDAKMGKEFFLGFARVITAMVRAPQPIVTRVHGKVVGGGVGLVAASDYVFAVREAALRLSELAVGIGPFVVGPAIEHKIGAAHFGAMALDADWRSAEWANAVGLYANVRDVLPSMDDAFDVFVKKLAASNPEATARIKRTLWAGTEHWDTLLDERAAMSGQLVLSEYTKRAIEAFKQQSRG